MQGMKIPAGTAVPDVTQVKVIHITTKMAAFR
jgi:hypothetical protein